MGFQHRLRPEPAMDFVPTPVPSAHHLLRTSSEMPPMEHKIAARDPWVTTEKSPSTLQILRLGLWVDPCGPPAWEPHGPAGPLQPSTQCARAMPVVVTRRIEPEHPDAVGSMQHPGVEATSAVAAAHPVPRLAVIQRPVSGARVHGR